MAKWIILPELEQDRSKNPFPLLKIMKDFFIGSTFYSGYSPYKNCQLSRLIGTSVLVGNMVEGFLYVIFNYCDQHKLNSIHLNCIDVETEIYRHISKPGKIKPKLSA